MQFFHETDTLFLEFFFRHACQENVEFVAAGAEDFARPEEITQEGSAVADHLVPGLMALAVVCVFQPVQVHKHNTHAAF